MGVRDGLRHDPKSDPVDVNAASESALENLPGVTPAMAAKVIANRPYRHTSDLVHRHILPKAIYDKVGSLLVAR